MTLTETNSEDTNSNDLRGISDRDLRTSVIANISDAKLLKKQEYLIQMKKSSSISC